MIIAFGINFCNPALRLNELITYVVSDEQNGEKILAIACKKIVFDLLCFRKLAS